VARRESWRSVSRETVGWASGAGAAKVFHVKQLDGLAARPQPKLFHVKQTDWNCSAGTIRELFFASFQFLSISDDKVQMKGFSRGAEMKSDPAVAVSPILCASREATAQAPWSSISGSVLFRLRGNFN
jgi:hypothetical protein